MAGLDRRSRRCSRALMLALGACLVAPLHAAMSQKAKLSYSMGFQLGSQVGQNLKAGHLAIDPALFADGVRDAVSGHKPVLSIAEMEGMMRQMAKQRMTALRKQATENQNQGAKFLAANRKEKGVITLPSGLQYRVLQKGTGTRPSLSDDALVNYKATFPDGHEFASGHHTLMPVRALVPGLRQALLLMNEGSEWQVVIPPNLGFGAGGPPPVGPNRTLVFDLRLIGVRKAPAASAPVQPAP